MNYFKLIKWGALALVLFAIDYYTKTYAMAHLDYGQAVRMNSFLDMVLVYNKGGSFSLLAIGARDIHIYFAIISIAYLIILAYFLLRTPKSRHVVSIGFAACMGGTLGNLYDRLTYGHVIDFIYPHFNSNMFPIINLADIFIHIGIAALMYALMKDLFTPRTDTIQP